MQTSSGCHHSRLQRSECGRVHIGIRHSDWQDDWEEDTELEKAGPEYRHACDSEDVGRDQGMHPAGSMNTSIGNLRIGLCGIPWPVDLGRRTAVGLIARGCALLGLSLVCVSMWIAKARGALSALKKQKTKQAYTAVSPRAKKRETPHGV